MYIGFVGYSSGDFDVNKAKNIINTIFSELIKDDIIVGGATNLGINKLVYEKAKQLGMKTVGIMCKKGFDYEIFNVDELIVVGEEWGDESQEFLSSIEVLYKIGGGQQSKKEFEMAKKMNIETHEYLL